MPLMPHLVEAEASRAAIRRAALAALAELQSFLAQGGCEQAQALEPSQAALEEALKQLLQGRLPATGKTGADLAVLLGSHQAFGSVRKPRTGERYTLATLAPESTKLLFFDGKGQFLPQNKLDSHYLYTTDVEAVEAVFEWMRSSGISPRQHPLKLALLKPLGEGQGMELVELGVPPT